MNNRVVPVVFTAAAVLLFCTGPVSVSPHPGKQAWMNASARKLENELVARYGEQQRTRLRRGMEQISGFWRSEDGGAPEFEDFVRTHYAGDREMLDELFVRFEHLLEQMYGHLNEIRLALCSQVDLDCGPFYPFDEVFAAYNPSVHIIDDFFANKLAFIVLLNFPLTTLDERLAQGASWTRRQWAEARLAQHFSKRIPAEANLAVSKAGAEADQYISGYNIWMHHLMDRDGNRFFPPKLRLLSHWNLRDEIKASYGDAVHGLDKQRMIQAVMERIITQTIPAVVVDNAHVDWNPYTNEVFPAAVRDSDSPPPDAMTVSNDPEPDTRYEVLLNTFRASRLVDPYSPTAPTLIARRFDEDREIPEARVKEMLEQVVSSPVAKRVAALIESRLGRPLEPFDIWYNGFRPRSAYSRAQLDSMVSSRYPTADAYRKDIPVFLKKLGFTEERASYLAQKILVEPARGSGHASGAEMRSESARLRTRVGTGGMDYKGFNIAVHEMGHNVEQVISLCDVDHTLLQGVPNTAFTEAFAFVFQERDLELLGLDVPFDREREALQVLDDFWSTYEIAGVALVDMELWHWMYDHPDAAAPQLKEAVIEISKRIWNRYYAPVLNSEDVILLGIYSHIIHSFLYLPDYPIGHLIAFQVREQMEKAGSIGAEFERMARLGRITPELWMQKATGTNVGAEALLRATERVLEKL